MKCPECDNAKTFVDVTRDYQPDDGDNDGFPYRSRSRRCAACGYRFTTKEEWAEVRMNGRTGQLHYD